MLVQFLPSASLISELTRLRWISAEMARSRIMPPRTALASMGISAAMLGQVKARPARAMLNTTYVGMMSRGLPTGTGLFSLILVMYSSVIKRLIEKLTPRSLV